MPACTIECVYAQGDAERLVCSIGNPAKIELFHYPPRCEVSRVADADDPIHAQLLEAIADACATSFGSKSRTPVIRVDQPPDLGLVRPLAVEGEPDPPDQHSRFLFLCRPQSEPVRVPMAPVPFEGLLTFGECHHRATHEAHHHGVCIPTPEAVEVVVSP